MAFLFTLLALLVVADPAQAQTSTSKLILNPQTFKSWMQTYSANEVFLPLSARRAARDLTFIFVGGFLNEGQAGYFKENIEELKRQGISDIKVLHPCSNNNIEEGADHIANQIRKLAQNGKQLVLISHSKGASETLLLALKYPTLVTENVQKIFLVQGALAGSPIADFLVGKGRPLSEKMPLVEKLAFQLTAFNGRLVSPLVNKGLTSLTSQFAQKLLANYLKAPAHIAPTINKKIFYITSYEHPKDVGDFLDCGAWYLQTSYGANDGMMLLKDQTIPGIGQNLITLKADHADLFSVNPISNAPVALRNVFTRALVLSAIAE